jgi:hypothetical protein
MEMGTGNGNGNYITLWKWELYKRQTSRRANDENLNDRP